MPANLNPVCDAASSCKPFSPNIQAFMKELEQPYKNPAPRGKKIISAEHARFLYLNESQLTQQDYDSTLSSEADASLAHVSKPVTPIWGVGELTNSQRRANARKLLAERQNQYHQQEMALGGYHDVFNDPCPVFKARDFRREDSVASTDDEEAELPDPVASISQMSVNENSRDENEPRSSQGRIGQGCSTPRCMANNTLAPLRAIDVSAVTLCESVEDQNVSPSLGCVHEPAIDQKTHVVPPPVQSTIAEPVAAARDDSMEDVLLRMRKTPKKTLPSKRKTKSSVTTSSKLLHAVHHKPESAAIPGEARISPTSNGTYTIEKEGTFTIVNTESSKHDGTYVVINDGTYVAAPTQNATLTVEAEGDKDSLSKHVEEAAPVAASPKEYSQQVQPEPVFAVPAVPARRSQNLSKITVDEREQRLNISQKKNKSLLEAMNVDVPSPGRALFASRPTKKPRVLPKTPVRSKPTNNDDAMEVSIAMSDISEQPSNASDDSSMVDPVSDPRPPQSTPTRAPGFIRRSGMTPTAALRTPPLPTLSNRDSQKPATPFAKMSAEKKREIIKKSVERLSQPKPMNTVCHKADAKPPHSPYVKTRSADVTMVEPVTPFEPIDPSRMIVANADRSGTAQRMPKPRFAKRQASLSVSLFAGKNEDTPRMLRSSLLKRMGDYKPKKIVEEAVASEDHAEPVCTSPVESVSVHVANIADETMVVPPAPPLTAADVSDVSVRATAGKNAVSTTSVALASPSDDMLADAARSLSLEDISPAGVVTDAADGVDDLPIVHPQPFPRNLLAESLCTVNTPHRTFSSSSKRRISTDTEPMEGDTVSAKDSVSSESEIVYYDPIEVQPQSRCSSRGSGKGDEVMILKPRVIVHPKPPSTPNVRRSTRNRMKPVRQWLGEKPIYMRSPGGSKILVGVNEVEVKDKRWLKVRTADGKLAQEREHQLAERQRRLRELRKAEARKRKEYKIRELKKRHRRGEDLETTVDSIVTSSDEDEEEDIEAIVHVR